MPLSWDGGYAGGFVGMMQGKSNTTVDGWNDRLPVQKCYTNEETGEEKCHIVRHQFVNISYPGITNDGNVIGIMFGAYGGYNKQLNRALVVGLELDGAWSGARDYNTIYAVTSSHKMPWNFNFTGRLGFLVTPQQNTMLYVKAGLNVKEQRSEITSPSATASENKTKAGWTAGLGVEHKFDQRLLARVEGMYEKVSDQTVSIPGASTTLKGGAWNAKVGLAWAFN